MPVDVVGRLGAERAASIEQWTDARVVGAETVDTWLWFFQHSYANFSQIGAELLGFSCNYKRGDWLLVVRVEQEGVRRVGFITSANPTRCMLRLKRSLEAGELRLVDDRFA